MRLDAVLPVALAGLAQSASLALLLPAASSPPSLPASTHATLASLGALYTAPLSVARTFVFGNVTPGSYLADVHCPELAFRPLRIDVASDGAVAAWETFRGNAWANKGETLHVSEAAVVELRPLGRKTYFVERPAFSVLSILKSPMILMGLVSMLIFIGMPYLMDNMDPEMKAEFEAQQKKGGPMAAIMGGGQQAGNPLGEFDMAAFLAGSKKKGSGQAGESGGDAATKNKGIRR